MQEGKGSTHTLFSTWASFKMMGPRVIGMQPLHWGILGALYFIFYLRLQH